MTRWINAVSGNFKEEVVKHQAGIIFARVLSDHHINIPDDQLDAQREDFTALLIDYMNAMLKNQPELVSQAVTKIKAQIEEVIAPNVMNREERMQKILRDFTIKAKDFVRMARPQAETART